MSTYATSVEEIRGLRSDRERVSHLLLRYPRVSEAESREILSFMRTARHLDIGLLTSNDRLRPRLDAFMADHKKHFQVKWTEGLAVAGAIALLLTTLWLVGGALF